MRSNKKMTRVAAAMLTTAALVGGLAACSSEDAKNAANKATDAAGSVAANATDKAGEAADKAGEAGKDAMSKADEAGKGAMDKAKEAKDAAAAKANEIMQKDSEDVAEADLPESITQAADSFYENTGVEAGAFVSAKKLGDATMAEYENVTLVESPETNGAQPLTGKIRETWVANGALANEIGLPTEAERVIDKGWEQKFTKDTMQWTSENGQDYSDSYLGQQ